MSNVGNIVAKLGNLFKSRWNRKLIDSNIEGRDGSLTVEGRDVVLRLLAQKAYESAYTDESGAQHETMRQFIGEGLVKRDKEIAAEREEQ